MKQYTDTFSWTNAKVEVRSAGGSGLGVFAKEKIKKEEMLAVFGGYVMTIEEESELSKEFNDNSVQVTPEFVLGIKKKREMEIACFFNHSCEPNAGFHGQICLVAMRDILPGEEVTFDYATVLSDSKTGMKYKMKCLCGKEKCRGVVTSSDWKKQALQKKYKGYFQYYLERKIKESTIKKQKTAYAQSGRA